MPALRTAIAIIWLLFWLYWLIAAIGAKASTAGRRRFPPGVRIFIVAFLLVRIFNVNALDVHDRAVAIVGTIVFALGIATAVWARIYIGRNWGMPMTQKQEPELVTGGPYRLVRHPIYTGILAALLGTALATNLYWLIAFGLAGAYFFHSARVEEAILSGEFPAAYPAYRARTKMLIPFVL